MDKPDQRITITAAAADRMLSHCRGTHPLEACGVLAASAAGIQGAPMTIEAVYAIANASSEAESSFAFHPADWVKACYAMQKNRQTLAGFFHSHPNGSLVPSLRDLNGLPSLVGGTYWIVSLPHPQAEPLIRAYRIALGGSNAALMLAEISIQIAKRDDIAGCDLPEERLP